MRPNTLAPSAIEANALTLLLIPAKALFAILLLLWMAFAVAAVLPGEAHGQTVSAVKAQPSSGNRATIAAAQVNFFKTWR